MTIKKQDNIDEKEPENTNEKVEYIIKKLPKSEYINTIYNIVYNEQKNRRMIINISSI